MHSCPVTTTAIAPCWTSPALRKLVKGILDNLQEEAVADAWVARQLACAPPLTAIQRQMLRRLKRDLVKAVQVPKAA